MLTITVRFWPVRTLAYGCIRLTGGQLRAVPSRRPSTAIRPLIVVG